MLEYGGQEGREDEKVEREVRLLGVGGVAADDEGKEFDDVGGLVLDVLDDGGPQCSTS